MQVAITTWRQRISPVFDTANTFLLARVEGGKLLEARMVELTDPWPQQRVARLKELGVDLLVCGAVSRPVAMLLKAAGIDVVPWVAGPVELVLERLIAGGIPGDEFAMPGRCGRRRGRGRKRRRMNCGRQGTARGWGKTELRKEKDMKIAVSAQGQGKDAQVDPRFGRAKYFVIFDTDSGNYDTIDNKQVLNLPQGAGIQAAQHVIDAGAEVLLTGHCGPNAFKTLQAGGVKVVVNVEGKVSEAVERYLEGELEHAGGPDVEGHW